MSKFDDLFNDFMGDGSNKKRSESDDMMTNLFKKLGSLGKMGDGDFIEQLKSLKAFDSTLGEPTKVISYEEDGVYYQKKIWETKHGQIIKTMISDVPFSEKKDKAKKTRVPLELQLETAVSEENYELAAKLRDRISKREAKKAKKE